MSVHTIFHQFEIFGLNPNSTKSNWTKSRSYCNLILITSKIVVVCKRRLVDTFIDLAFTLFSETNSHQDRLVREPSLNPRMASCPALALERAEAFSFTLVLGHSHLGSSQHLIIH